VEEPYRSEVESLRAENERLKLELAKKRVSRPVLALVLAAMNPALVVVLRPWLNGPSDGGFWLAVGAIGFLALAAAAAAFGRRRVAI
jgi:hypothetical protein